MNNLAGSLIRNFEIKPDKVCLVQEGQKITYKNLYEKVVAFKHVMKEKGITKGSKVLVLVPMSIELYVTLISLWSIGAIPCFMDAGFIKSGMKNNDFDDIQAVIGIKKYLLMLIQVIINKLVLIVYYLIMQSLNIFIMMNVMMIIENYQMFYMLL